MPYPFYFTYLFAGVPGKTDASGKTGFHVAMRETHLDELVTELILTRLVKADSLAELGQRGDGNDTERHALLQQIAGYQEYLDKLREEAAEKLRFDLLLDQEERIVPRIRAAQARLEKFSEIDPVVLRLLNDGAIQARWTEFWIVEKRRVVRAVVTPRVNRIDPSMKGQRGINRERVDLVWR